MKNGKKSSFIACELCETADACVLLESSSCMLHRVFECLGIDTGVARTRVRFAFRFLMRDSFRQNLTSDLFR